MVAFLPSLLIVLLLGRTAALLVPRQGPALLAAVLAPAMMFWLVMGVAIASRLYVTLGNRLNRAA